MISPQGKAALLEALEDECKAFVTYRAVIDRFGEIRPFINIVESERRHMDALIRLCEKYAVTIPSNITEQTVDIPDELHEVCAQAINAEIENIAMYGRLIAAVPETDITTVLARLQEASRERHLPAFRRCLRRHANSG